MKILLCDTSTENLVLVLYNDSVIVDSLFEKLSLEHGKYLVNRIHNLLQKNGIQPANLDGLIIGIGPGSYTGLRIGLMVLKMLSYSTGIPLYSVSSLTLLTSGYTDLVCAYMDARRGYVYGCIRDIKKEYLADTHIDYKELEKTATSVGAHLVEIKQNTIKLDIDIIKKNMHQVIDIYHIVPNYLRKTQAEEEHDKKS